MRNTLIFLVISLLLGTPASTVLANDDDEAVKYRKEVFEAVGAHMHSIVAILKGKVDHPDHLATHAEALALAATLAKPAFEMEAMGDDEETTATPEIWENWDKFAGGMDKLVEESQKLAEVAKSGNKMEIGKQTQALGRVCKGCHDNFRDK